MSDQNDMEKIVAPMMEHLCDPLCRFPWETERKEDLEDICAGCQMGQYVCDILNTYKQVNDFEKSQCVKLLKELAIEREKQRWIPVSKQLPELDESGYAYVMVCMDDEFVTTTDYTRDEGFSLWAESGEVIAWMPLPEPYRPEQLHEAGWKDHLLERFGRCE